VKFATKNTKNHKPILSPFVSFFFVIFVFFVAILFVV